MPVALMAAHQSSIFGLFGNAALWFSWNVLEL